MIPDKAKSGFCIGVSCPGCGGALELQADFFVVVCKHCGSVLRIELPEIPPAYLVQSKINKTEVRFQFDRYLRANKHPLTRANMEITGFYYPYWKIDAIVLKLRNKIEERITAYQDPSESYQTETSIKQKKTDIALTPFQTTIAAGGEFDEIPFSIGMRADYIKLLPFAQDNIQDGFDSYPAIKSWGDIQTALTKNVNIVGKIISADFGINKTELFHPVGSIVYFPYYKIETTIKVKPQRFIIDALTGRVVHDADASQSAFATPSTANSAMQFGQLQVGLHRCPQCGDDLPPQQSFAYVCRNCNQFIALEKNPHLRNEVLSADLSNSPDTFLFPFWSLRLSPETARRLRVIFGGIYNSEYLVIPGFKIPNFEAMFRLSKRISTAAPKLELVPVENFDSRFAPVTLGLYEALALTEVIIYREKVGKQIDSAEKREIFESLDITLFYAPFHPENYFYVDSVLGAITFEKNLVD
jgi:hypothetical protein